MQPPQSLKNSFPSNPPTFADIESFCSAAKVNDISTVERMLDEFGGAIVNAQDSIRACGLTWAAWGGCDEVIKLLLDRGADINAQGTSGKPALSWAIEMGKAETVALLLDRGASLDVRDDSGQTPLDLAQRASYSGITDIVTQWVEEKQQTLRDAERRAVEQQERDARDAVAERLRKLRENAPGKIKIAPGARPRNPGPKR